LTNRFREKGGIINMPRDKKQAKTSDCIDTAAEAGEQAQGSTKAASAAQPESGPVMCKRGPGATTIMLVISRADKIRL